MAFDQADSTMTDSAKTTDRQSQVITQMTQARRDDPCSCGGPPCRTCPQVACRHMTRNEWFEAVEAEIASREDVNDAST